MLTRAAGSPLVRGGLTIGAGILLGNLTGFVRVALIAFFLGTGSLADSLAVAIGPLDTLNAVLINSFVFAFVPMLTEKHGPERAALFFRLNGFFFRILFVFTAGVVVFAPWLVHALGPGLDRAHFGVAVWNLRIGALSILAAGTAGVHSALLYTERRFAPSAFYQLSLNVGTIAGALTLWKLVGVHGFALGYAAGAWLQLAIMRVAVRRTHNFHKLPPSAVTRREMVAKPSFILLYSGMVALNMIFSRAHATSAGPGMAAALDYTMRCIGVPLAFLVMPISNSVLPEIARLRKIGQLKDAFRLIDRMTVLTALAAVAATTVSVLLREPIVALLFERGSFTVQSTRLVSAVLLGFAPTLIGWSLIELTSRSLFALGHHWLPVWASAVPVAINVALSLGFGWLAPQQIGLGPSIGFLAGYLLLMALARANRRQWLAQA